MKEGVSRQLIRFDKIKRSGQEQKLQKEVIRRPASLMTVSDETRPSSALKSKHAQYS